MVQALKKEKLSVEDKILKIIVDTLDDNKAENVSEIDLQGKTSIARYMVVASGTSQRHVAALAEHVRLKLKEAKSICIVKLPDVSITHSVDIKESFRY